MFHGHVIVTAEEISSDLYSIKISHYIIVTYFNLRNKITEDKMLVYMFVHDINATKLLKMTTVLYRLFECCLC